MSESEESSSHREPLILLVSVFLIAICSLVYELLAGAVSSYLLGSSVLQFSLVIGIFLTAMGIGSFFSRFIHEKLMTRFILIEIAIGTLGGFSSFFLFFAFSSTEIYRIVLVLITGGIGILSGLEIPLVLRILKNKNTSLRLSVANVMTADYLGALVASLAFPLILVPHLGLMQSAFMLGLLNVGVAVLCIFEFRNKIGKDSGLLKALALLVFCLLLGGFCLFHFPDLVFESRLYPDEIVYSEQTPYQRIVITRWKNDTRLFLNGNLQFSSSDEYRYHESLVHPAMGVVALPRKILILGGGDGMVARECLKYAEVEAIDLVDLDPKMTGLFSTSPMLCELNNNSLNDKKVNIKNLDALNYLKDLNKVYDVIIVDLPDPSVLDIGKLYSRTFYAYALHSLAPGGVIAVQSSSPFFATDAFWCIANTIASVTVPELGEASHLSVLPYHVNVPSFGDWGFVLASRQKVSLEDIKLKVKTRFLNAETLKTMSVFPKDIKKRPTEINRLDNQILVQYYNKGYQSFYE